MGTIRSFKIVLVFTLLVLMSCSKSEVDNITNHNFAETIWTYREIENISGDVFQYQVLEFTSNNDFTVSIEDMNKIKTQYLAIGTYIVEGSKIFCTSTFENTTKKYILFVDYQNNTIYNASTPNKIYVKE